MVEETWRPSFIADDDTPAPRQEAPLPSRKELDERAMKQWRELPQRDPDDLFDGGWLHFSDDAKLRAAGHNPAVLSEAQKEAILANIYQREKAKRQRQEPERPAASPPPPPEKPRKRGGARQGKTWEEVDLLIKRAIGVDSPDVENRITWSANQWATFCACSPNTVIKCPTFQSMERSRLAAAAALERQRQERQERKPEWKANRRRERDG